MNRPAAERIHTVEIPIAGMSLLVPSASIAEVANVPVLTPIPFSATWLLGALSWRQQALPVVSFEALIGLPVEPVGAGSKVVVFYPLTGRKEWEFFGMLSAFEPRPHAVDSSNSDVAGADDLPTSPFIAGGIKLAERIMAIPNMGALKRAFYP